LVARALRFLNSRWSSKDGGVKGIAGHDDVIRVMTLAGRGGAHGGVTWHVPRHRGITAWHGRLANRGPRNLPLPGTLLLQKQRRRAAGDDNQGPPAGLCGEDDGTVSQ
jgi:hypothetical protein